MARPRKYHTEVQRIAAKKLSRKRTEEKRPRRIRGKVWRIVIPHLEAYGANPPRDNLDLQDLKRRTLDLLHANENSRGLSKWCVAWQTHPGSGYAHLDILLIYSKCILNPMTRYDYLVKHGNLTKYRTLNRAILEYNLKEDKRALTNLNVKRKLLESQVKDDLYALMEQAMLKCPFKFTCHQWLDANDLYRAAAKTNLYKSIRMVKDRQQVVCNKILVAKPGIRLITRAHVIECLPPAELAMYDSWAGYQTIMNHLNHIPRYGCNRPHKTLNLLIVGRPNTGKTALALMVKKHCAVYPKGVTTWFPSYRSGVYSMTLWNEFTLGGMPFSDILNFLEGNVMDLQYKGGMTRKDDNQLVYMTSNWSLEEHICKKFKLEPDRAHARLNLRARIEEVIIPASLNLFLLLRLIAPAQ